MEVSKQSTVCISEQLALECDNVTIYIVTHTYTCMHETHYILQQSTTSVFYSFSCFTTQCVCVCMCNNALHVAYMQQVRCWHFLWNSMKWCWYDDVTWTQCKHTSWYIIYAELQQSQSCLILKMSYYVIILSKVLFSVTIHNTVSMH